MGLESLGFKGYDVGSLGAVKVGMGRLRLMLGKGLGLRVSFEGRRGCGALTGAQGSAGLCHHTLPTAQGSGLGPSHPRCPLAPSPHPQAGTMAQVGHRVDYLAGFCCPVGGLVAGKPRVLCHENEIYLSNGTEFVYVYDQEGKVLKVRGLVGWGSHPVSPIPWGQCPVTQLEHPPVMSPPPIPGFPLSRSNKQTLQAAPLALGFGHAASCPLSQSCGAPTGSDSTGSFSLSTGASPPSPPSLVAVPAVTAP